MKKIQLTVVVASLNRIKLNQFNMTFNFFGRGEGYCNFLASYTANFLWLLTMIDNAALTFTVALLALLFILSCVFNSTDTSILWLLLHCSLDSLGSLHLSLSQCDSFLYLLASCGSLHNRSAFILGSLYLLQVFLQGLDVAVNLHWRIFLKQHLIDLSPLLWSHFQEIRLSVCIKRNRSTIFESHPFASLLRMLGWFLVFSYKTNIKASNRTIFKLNDNFSSCISEIRTICIRTSLIFTKLVNS